MLKKLLNAFKDDYLPYLFAYSAKLITRLLLFTCRFEVQGLEQFIATAVQFPCIITLWHNRLVIVAETLSRFAPQFIYTAFVSNSRDGHPLSLLARSYKSGRVLRVPHNARRRALSQMIEHLKNKGEVIIITPDGPRGPRYIVKPGVVVAAKETAAKIIPFSWECNRFWQLNTWDQMMIPKPFSKIKVVFGEAIALCQDQKIDLKSDLDFLQFALSNLESVQ